MEVGLIIRTVAQKAAFKCIKADLINAANKLNYVSMIIADHGNCEKMKNKDGSPNTSHTTNPVPVILVDKNKRNIRNGILADIAPTVLEILGIKKPIEMTGKSLIVK